MGNSEGLSMLSPGLSRVTHKGPISTGDATRGFGHVSVSGSDFFFCFSSPSRNQEQSLTPWPTKSDPLAYRCRESTSVCR